MKMVNIFMCGDIMPGGVLPYQDDYITSELREFMKNFDFRIGTLEAAIGTGLTFDPVKLSGRQNIVYARNEDFFRIKEMGFDVVSLANNHVWDLGEEGLRNTIQLLQQNGIQYCGAGLNAEEASRPAVIEKNGFRVAIFAYCMYGNKYLGYVELAEKNKAGINPLDIDKVIGNIKDARRNYDKVIIMPHWGREYRYDPLPECIRMAKQMIDAGADAVMGSHTHQVQPLIQYKGKPICFSMGNFLFPDFFMQPPRPIWYPESVEQVKGIEDVVGYPYPIEKPIRQVWNKISRNGHVVLMVMNKRKCSVKLKTVSLSDDNVEGMVPLPSHIRKALLKSKIRLIYHMIRH